MVTVSKHAWATNAKAQIARAKKGNCEFSHKEDLPLRIGIKNSGWLCRKVYVTTLEPIWYVDAVCRIEIEAGFHCDLASIPRGIWFLVSPYDLAFEGILHDSLYRSQRTTRQYADFLFLLVMEQRGVPSYVRYPAWLAVRMFGGKAWKQNQRRLEKETKP